MKSGENHKSKLFELPLFIYIFASMLTLGLIVFIIASINESFADFWNRYPAAFLRGTLAVLTNAFPFSLAEITLISLPIAVIIIIIMICKGKMDKIKRPWIFTVSIISAASLFVSLFTLGFGVGYHTSPLDEKLGLEKKPVSKEELAETAAYLADMVNESAQQVEFLHESFSIMPYGFNELGNKLNIAYDRLCGEYNFIPQLHSRIKPVLLSEAMSYTHITGIYTYFSGEANVNVNFPDYTLPFTAAHEMAHQRGISREDEANFIAFLVCSRSDDPYIKYSGYLNLYEYVASALSSYSELYSPIAKSIDTRVIYEMIAYSSFFDKYRHSTVGKISESVNNSYLQSMGTSGTKSYGMVVDLAVAYLKNDISK